MRDVRTPGHTTTGGSSTREAGTSSTLSSWRRPGRRRWTNGPAGRKQSFLSGSERDQARSPESPSLLMMRTKARLTLLVLVVLRRKRRNNLVLKIINLICFELLEFPNLRNIHRLQIEK